MLLVWLAYLGRLSLAADVQVPDFRIRWLLHQESGGVEQLEQWNVACVQSKCHMGRWVSGKDFGQKPVPPVEAKALLEAAEGLPAAAAPSSQAMRATHHEERVWVDRFEKSTAKVRPRHPENEDISSGLAWARFELDLRHVWEGQRR